MPKFIFSQESIGSMKHYIYSTDIFIDLVNKMIQTIISEYHLYREVDPKESESLIRKLVNSVSFLGLIEV